jgi:hypothetical protein
MVVAFDLTEKRQFAEKVTETPYFLIIKPKFWIGYTVYEFLWVLTNFKILA